MKQINGLFKNFSNWAGGLFKDESGTPSSKRFVGIICALTLCVTMYHNSFSTVDIAPAQYLVDAVALLAFATLGLSSVDKFTATKKDINKATTPVAPPAAPAAPSADLTCAVCNSEPCVCS